MKITVLDLDLTSDSIAKANSLLRLLDVKIVAMAKHDNNLTYYFTNVILS